MSKAIQEYTEHNIQNWYNLSFQLSNDLILKLTDKGLIGLSNPIDRNKN